MSCLKDQSNAKEVKHHLYHDESQSAELVLADATEQEEDKLALSEESDFRGFTADDLL
jgi:hypothetical protein